MNKLRIVSDLHMEWGELDLPTMENEKGQDLIIAGDFDPVHKGTFEEYVGEYCSRFANVIYVAGNHEFYGGSLIEDVKALRELSNDYENFHFLQNDILYKDDVIYLGCTLWTDFDEGDPIAMSTAHYGMNDFVHIKYGENVFTPTNWIAENKLSREFLWDSLEELKEDPRAKVVITHHLPSFESIDEQFKYNRGEHLNYAYASDNMYEWLAMADVWFHGHTHVSQDYLEAGCRVVCNPRGYHRRETNYSFDPLSVINVPD